MSSSKLKTILVTGGTGFLGQTLCQHLVSKNFRITATYLNTRPVFQHPNLTWIAADLLQQSSFNLLPVPDNILHLAAALPVSMADSTNEGKQNRQMDTCILTFADRHQIPLVYASSSSVYDNNPSDCANENIPLSPANPYSKEKYQFEQEGVLWQSRSGVPFTALRINAPYGPGQRTKTVLNLFIENALQNNDLLYYGSGNREQDFTYCEDIARAFELALKSEGGIYNISAGQPVSMKQLGELVLTLCHDSKSKLKSADCPDPNEGQKVRFSIQLAAEKLGWQPQVSLKEGLKACIQWRKNELEKNRISL